MSSQQLGYLADERRRVAADIYDGHLERMRRAAERSDEEYDEAIDLALAATGLPEETLVALAASPALAAALRHSGGPIDTIAGRLAELEEIPDVEIDGERCRVAGEIYADLVEAAGCPPSGASIGRLISIAESLVEFRPAAAPPPASPQTIYVAENTTCVREQGSANMFVTTPDGGQQ